MVIAPLDANTMAKMAIGMCDNLLVRQYMYNASHSAVLYRGYLACQPGNL